MHRDPNIPISRIILYTVAIIAFLILLGYVGKNYF